MLTVVVSACGDHDKVLCSTSPTLPLFLEQTINAWILRASVVWPLTYG